MCGIVAYIGNKQAQPIVIKGLKRLEYRGYDSTGMSIFNGSALHTLKTKGKVSDLEALIAKQPEQEATLALGHTRWATHGVPNDVNAHPQTSNSGNLVIVHNGIIENYSSLKKELQHRGFTFQSDTDTEVLINLIQDVQDKENVKLGKAVQIALSQVVGAYAIVVFDRRKPNELVAARLGSPLAIGIGEDEFFVASDATPFVEYTKNVIYLEEEHLAIIRRNKSIKIHKIQDDLEVEPYVEKLKLSLENIQKGGYDHFMLKEIFEQPTAIKDTLRGRLLSQEGVITLSSLREHENRFLKAKRILIVACGTSWHAGLVAEYLIEDFTRIPVEVEYASEFRYRNPIIYPDDVVIAISQSGETADTIAAINIAKEKGAFVYGICNVVGSTISRITNTGCYTHAGPEIGVASTKAFTTQITVIALIGLYLGKANGTLSRSQYQEYVTELEDLPNKVESIFASQSYIEEVAASFETSSNCIYLGRGYNFPVALEGALKLKEISYIHAEGYPAAEMKHGPIALIDEEMPVVVIATKKGYYEKVVSNIQEIKSRKGRIIAIVSQGDTQVKDLADYCIEIPDCSESFVPILSTIPLQLLSYYIAVQRGCNVDQPRNLAKSVTVE
ncbi:glutamine--fructose-6-phosphate transaminase (isomerizing) [Flavobacteriaceae bacterium]|nr:glutamine--fructose-6-phosphate transaminase (isomerizing) [Flavobacteriaceae bacterium]